MLEYIYFNIEKYENSQYKYTIQESASCKYIWRGVKKWVIREKVKAPGKEVQKILFRKQKVPAVVQVEIAKISLAPNPTMIL